MQLLFTIDMMATGHQKIQNPNRLCAEEKVQKEVGKAEGYRVKKFDKSTKVTDSVKQSLQQMVLELNIYKGKGP